MKNKPLYFGLMAIMIVVITRLSFGDPFGLTVILSGVVGGIAAWFVLWAHYKFIKKSN
jgi:hypothetical protein